MIKKEPQKLKNYISPKREVVWIELGGKTRRVVAKDGKFYLQTKEGDEFFGTTKEGNLYVFERRKGNKNFKRGVFLSGVRRETESHPNRTNVRHANRRHIFLHCIFCMFPEFLKKIILRIIPLSFARLRDFLLRPKK